MIELEKHELIHDNLIQIQTYFGILFRSILFLRSKDVSKTLAKSPENLCYLDIYLVISKST